MAFGSAFAAGGASKTLRYTINNDAMGGYVPTPVQGYKQSFTYKMLNSSGKMAVFNVEEYDSWGSLPSNPPDPAYLTLVDGKGAVISKEALPVQVQSSDCISPYWDSTPVYNVCPYLQKYFAATPLVNKYLLDVTFGNYYDQSHNVSCRDIQYVLDLNAAVGSPQRWSLISDTQVSDAGICGYSMLKAHGIDTNIQQSNFTQPAFMFLIDSVSNPGGAAVYSIK